MPTYTNAPGQKNLVFVNPKAGKFHMEKDGDQVEFQAIEGNLDLVRVEFDPGNPTHKIQPYDAFIMHIADEETVYRIKMNIDRNFTFSIAKVLNDLKKGDRIIAKTSMGSDPTITFCNILKQDTEGNWVRPALQDLPTDKDKKIAFIKDMVENHSAYAVKKESTE